MSAGTLETNTSTSVFVPAVSGSNEATLEVTGTWGGGTITVYRNIDGQGLMPVPDETYIADFCHKTNPGHGVGILMTLSGATSPELNWSMT